MKRPALLLGMGLALGSVALAGCVGEVFTKGKTLLADGGITGPDCTLGTVGAQSMLRLTRAEYDNIAADVLHTKVQPSTLLSTDDLSGVFSINSQTLMSTGLAQQYQTVAEAVGTDVEANVQATAPCTDTSSKGAPACAKSFIQSFGRRVFRRPLSADEQTRWLATFTTAFSGGYANAIRTVVEGMLQSPNFLFRLELAPGGTDPNSATGYALDDYALASRLSFLLWDSAPDDALLDAAAAGKLSDSAGYAAVVKGMLDDPKVLRTMRAFGTGWAGLDQLMEAASSPARLGGLDPSLVPLMRDETINYLDDVLRKGDGKFATLVGANYTVADPKVLSTLYGITTPPDANGRTPLDPAQRTGFLTQPAIQFIHAHSDQTSPVLRGKWVRESLFCQKMPDPPANVNTTPPVPDGGENARERFAQHRTDPTCSSCHLLMDDIGFAFENYDQYGKWRTVDANQPIDATGVLHGTDVDGNFDGPHGLAQRLIQSPSAHDCFAQEWFEYGMGRSATSAEACLSKQLSATMQTGGGFRDYVQLLTASEVFHKRRSP